ncbi:transcriptional repressor NrdR [Candidatus Methylacidiphilum infernorum]|uniref:Transcriptional repressor NrdR n=1 Tax=Candidatus Methylacidiphilum infernorum TaxID=511746 RepID=A0ABX7PW57_9BACT|nr:transcriptional regulator NrdR [Candidatus Methylacidiphilum infernorum]QSR86883.1 transcriptional repressor NrdR [Candidatus Methylacidiphilum infernorum]
MKCIKCGNMEDRVIDSRPIKEGKSIRRRRECLRCGYRFTTYEEVQEIELFVKKRNGSIEQFDRNKLMIGIQKALEKRPITQSQIEDFVDQIIEECSAEKSPIIPSFVIGTKVMNKLKTIDEVAFIRFASVYCKFHDAKDFMNVISELKMNEDPSKSAPMLLQASSK